MDEWYLSSSATSWLLLVLTLLLALYWYATWNHSLFKSLGLNYIKPQPLFGNLKEFFAVGPGFFDLKYMQKFHGKPYGMFLGMIPQVVITDPDDMKRLLVKEFSRGPNRLDLGLRGKVMSQSLIMARDDRWHNQRYTLAPTFSSAKIKEMTPWIQDCAARFVQNLVDKAKSGEEVDMMNLSGSMTMDVIAGTGFGLETDALNNPEGDFVRHGKNILDRSLRNPALFVTFFARFLIPLCDAVGISINNRTVVDYYTRVLKGSIQQRSEHGLDPHGDRTDLLQLMMNRIVNARDKKHKDQRQVDKSGEWVKKGMTEDEVIGNGILFLVAGFETTANTLTFFAHCVATHPEVQTKLRQEINEVFGKEIPDFERIDKLQYLEQCINETLRLFPPGLRIDRQLTQPFSVQGVTLPAGTCVVVPIFAIQRDPNLWPDPEKFDPERFRPDVAPTKDDFRFMPFGLGPRTCIGKRMAWVVMKLTLARMLQRVELKPGPKTEIPIQLNKEWLLKPKGEVYLRPLEV